MICLIRLLLLAAACLAPATAQAAPRLRIGVERQSPPLATLDANGQPVGYAVELLQEMARTGGLEIEIVPDYWKNNFARFGRGDLDAMASIVRTQANVQELDLSIGHARIHGVVYRRADRPAIRHTRDFAGKTIATVRGTAANADALENPQRGATIRTCANVQEAFDVTQRGECDAALFTNRVSFPNIDTYQLRREFVDDLTYQIHMAVRKGDRTSLALINQALADVIASRALDRIYSKWIGPIEPRPIRLTDIRPYFLPAAISLLAVAGILGWQRHMLRRLAQQAEQLRLSEERWKFALEGSGAAVWDWDIAQSRVLFSQHWKELLGLGEAEIGNRPEDAAQLVHPDDLPKVTAAREAHWRDPAVPFAIEYRMLCQDGAWKWILDRGMVVRRSPDGKPLRMIGTCMDLTDRKQAEADRLVLGKLQSTGILAGGLAHDFNNLLTVITLNLDLARMGHALDPDLDRHLRDIAAAATAASALTQQLITFADGGNAVRQPVPLPRILQEAAQIALSGSGLEAELQLAADLWTVEGDPPQLGQVFRNLILNAREAMTAPGTVVLQGRNVTLAAGEVPLLTAGDFVRLSVIDRGHGIAAEMLSKIFDPYFSTKERGAQRGMGLGLTICHSIVAKHGGAIVVESKPGAGAAFHVYLPAGKGPAAAAAEPAAAPAAEASPGRVLVMDDEESLRHGVGLALTRMGYDVLLAPDGETALALYRSSKDAGVPVDAVLLDLTVRGGKGGLATLQELRAIDPAVNALVMSGYADNEILRDYARHGFRGALAKPFTAGALRHALQSACSG